MSDVSPEDVPPVIRRIDFSQFHPIGTHLPFSRFCKTQYGGGAHHLALVWEYRWRGRVLSPYHRARCFAGHHTYVDGWKRDDDTSEMHPAKWCVYCDDPNEPPVIPGW